MDDSEQQTPIRLNKKIEKIQHSLDWWNMNQNEFNPIILSPEEFRERVHRPVKRGKTSCQPCRGRKVKCDGTKPCATCQKRGHTDLCSYGASLREWRPAEPSYETTREGRTTPFLGDDSIPAFVESENLENKDQANGGSSVNECFLPMLGLRPAVASPYPFMPPLSSNPWEELTNDRDTVK
jgi:hypothetical protein